MFERIKNAKLTTGVVDCPDSFFACYFSAAVGCGMGRGVCNSSRRGMKEHRRSGARRVTIK